MKPIIVSKKHKAVIEYRVELTEELFNKLIKAYHIESDVDDRPLITFEQYNELVLNGEYRFCDKYGFYPYVKFNVWDGSHSHHGSDYYSGEEWSCPHTPGWERARALITDAMRRVLAQDFANYEQKEYGRPKDPQIVDWNSLKTVRDDGEFQFSIDIPSKVKVEYYE